MTLYANDGGMPTRLGAARTDREGAFKIAYRPQPRDAVIYAVAAGGRASVGRALRLLAVANPGFLTPGLLTVNELSTVAAAYSLAHFLHGSRLAGPSPGLPNAALTVGRLVRTSAGTVGNRVANPPNGTATKTLATFRTLAAVLAGCTTGAPRDCRALFKAAKPPRGRRPANTLQAIHDIALNPAANVKGIFALRKSRAYRPLLRRAPSSWVLSLKHTNAHTNAPYDGPGRMAFDSKGNIWVTNNFEPPGTEPGTFAISLDPAGDPLHGDEGAVRGGGILGNWWGVAVDRRDRVWLSNFTGDDPREFDEPGFEGGNIVSLFTPEGRAVFPEGTTAGELKGPQGIAVNKQGDVFIANHEGRSVTMYPRGNPAAARVIRGGGLYNPFAIVTDAAGNAWVDNGSLDTSAAGSLTKITRSGRAIGPFAARRMRSPQGMAIDSAGNIWVASLANDNVTWIAPNGRVKDQFRVPSIEGPWSVAIDGDDNVWVASFIGEKVTLLCGRIASNCPPGARTGDSISPSLHGFTNGGLQHVTAVQVDQSGNVWVANNWEDIEPIVGGDGLVQFIGAAPPVDTPLIGPPRPPR